MKEIICTIIMVGLASCQNIMKKTECPPEIIATGKGLSQEVVNDSLEKVFLNDTLWFEIIGTQNQEMNWYSSYLKFYRLDGTIEMEGTAYYLDHPVADFYETGKWIYYNCSGEIERTKFFQNKEN